MCSSDLDAFDVELENTNGFACISQGSRGYNLEEYVTSSHRRGNMSSLNPNRSMGRDMGHVRDRPASGWADNGFAAFRFLYPQRDSHGNMSMGRDLVVNVA